MKELLVFGTGDFADVVSYLLEQKLGRSIRAYIVDERYRTADTYQGKPLLSFERIQESYPPEACEVALGMIGKQMFRQRAEVFRRLCGMGYTAANVIDPTASVDTEQIGAGNIIFAHASVEAHCRIGDGNIIWQNVVLPHHNQVGNFNNLAPSVSFSGYSRVGNHCFIGNNVCVKNRVEIADEAYIGAGAYVSQHVAPRKVIVPHRSYELEGRTGFDFL